MSYKYVSTTGSWGLCGDTALKHRINRLIQSVIPTDDERAKARARLLRHPFIRFDDWSCAEERYRHDRVRHCEKMLEGLKVRFGRSEITYEGLEESRGTPHITADQLIGHSLRLIDVTDDLLLLRLERHPDKTGGTYVEQYWLYSRHRRTLRLLKVETFVHATLRPTKVKRGEGSWQDPNSQLEQDFWQVAESLLGRKAADLQKGIQHQEGRLLFPPQDVSEKIPAIAGIDMDADEQQKRLNRETTYLRKYGPQQSSGPPGIQFIPAGIKFGIAQAGASKSGAEPASA